MASTKDILDGQRFNRQRLVTAFTSGMPGGRELTPIHPWKGIIASLVITALVVGGAWISKLFAPSLPDGWKNGNLVINSSNGSRYVSIEGKLYPVLNAFSAHLLFPNLKTITANDDALATAPLGPVVGIPGAPDKVPAADKVRNADITACISSNDFLWKGVNMKEKVTSANGAALFVESNHVKYLIAGEYRYPFREGEGENPKAERILESFDIDDAKPIQVKAAWLNLFKEGEPLTPLQIDEGRGNVRVEGIDREYPVGTILREADEEKGTKYYLVRKDGKLQRMSTTAFHMYTLSSSGRDATPSKISSYDRGRATFNDEKLMPTWPEDIPSLVNNSTSRPCAHVATGQSTRLMVSNSIPRLTSDRVEVASQTGAIITQPGNKVKRYHLIDEDGLAYEMDNFEKTGESLGYKNVTPLEAPPEWMDLFSSGKEKTPTLSVEAAWSTVPADARKAANK